MIKKLLTILLLTKGVNSYSSASEVSSVAGFAYWANFALLVFSIVIFSLGYRQFVKLKNDIKALSEIVNKQIKLLNNFEAKIKMNERKRMSLKLHDQVAGTLAAIKNHIDILMCDANDEKQKSILQKLSYMTDEVFDNVRNQSHEYYEDLKIKDEQMFRQHILYLTRIFFPENQYNLKINIEKHALDNVTSDLKALLAQIIQETFANIVKHAQANQVDLLIYREQKNKLVLTVKDNGVGVRNKSSPDAIGIHSIRDRLAKYNGTFEMKNANPGVEIQIIMPDIKRVCNDELQ